MSNKELSPKEQKLAILEDLGRKDLVEIFKDWHPRTSKNRKKSAPLDQRVSISVTDVEREMLEREIAKSSSAGTRVTMSQLVRNRALASVDINEWRDCAMASLKKIEATAKARKTIEGRIREIKEELKSCPASLRATLKKERSDLESKLSLIIAQPQERKHRLSGRMSLIEAETIKWRAQRLCLSSSDYLRMMIFALQPESTGDAHLSYDGKRRFYISIVDVATNGWGTPPTIRQCSQCENYMDEIKRLTDRIAQLEAFL